MELELWTVQEGTKPATPVEIPADLTKVELRAEMAGSAVLIN